MPPTFALRPVILKYAFMPHASKVIALFPQSALDVSVTEASHNITASN